MKTDLEAVKDADKWNREAGRIERAESKRLNKEKGSLTTPGDVLCCGRKRLTFGAHHCIGCEYCVVT